jgi:hypothetical protein
MKKIIAISAALVLWTASAFAQCIPTSQSLPYSPGEDLKYTLSYNWLGVVTDVATATLQLDTVRFNGSKVYHARAKARTKSFFDAFFKAREDFQSWFTMDGKPLKYTRNTREGGYTATNLYTYNWNRRVINATWETSKHAKENLELPLSDCTYDLPSIIYFMRRLDTSSLQEGKTYKITYGIDEAVYTITLTYKGRETKRVRGIGKVKCLRFGCSVVAGEMFSGNEDAQMWVSDDENHIPVYFMAPLKVGAVAGRLSSYSGLTHELAIK